MEQQFGNLPEKNEAENISEKKESVKTINIELEGKSYPLEYSSYDFEYPESIQKETGILGYERNIILKEALRNLQEETGGNSGSILTKEILGKLSGNEFFDLVRHQMGWYASNSSLKESYAQEFADQKFILQKIFDLDSIEEIKKTTKGNIFSHSDDLGRGKNTIKFSIFDKQTLKVIEEDIAPTKLVDYREKIENGEYFACNTKGGLSDRSIVSGTGYRKPNLFHDKILFQKMKEAGLEAPTEFPVSPMFAFDPGEPALHEYFTELNELFLELNKANNTNITGNISDVFDNLYQKINYQELVAERKDGKKDYYRSQKYKDFIGKAEELEKLPDYVDMQMNDSRIEKDEGSLPVVIGLDKIKQLRWGDSKYAVFYTEKGLNFLNIKHKDKITNSTDEIIK